MKSSRLPGDGGPDPEAPGGRWPRFDDNPRSIRGAVSSSLTFRIDTKGN
jgi:hypothetical protein